MPRAGEFLLYTDDINKLPPEQNTERRDFAGFKSMVPGLAHINEPYPMPTGNDKLEEVDINKNRLNGASGNLNINSTHYNGNAGEEGPKIVEVVSLADYIEQPNANQGSKVPSAVTGSYRERSGKTRLIGRQEEPLNLSTKFDVSNIRTRKRALNKLDKRRYCQPVMHSVSGARPYRPTQRPVGPSEQTMMPACNTSSWANVSNINASLRPESFHGMQQASSASVLEYCTNTGKCVNSAPVPNDASHNRMGIQESPGGFFSNYHPEVPVTTALPLSQLGSHGPIAVAKFQSSYVQNAHFPNTVTHSYQVPVNQFGQPLDGDSATNLSVSPALLPNTPTTTTTTTMNGYSSTRLAPSLAVENSMRPMSSFPYGNTRQGPVKDPSQSGTAISVSCAKVADGSQTIEHYKSPPPYCLPQGQPFVIGNQNVVSAAAVYTAAPSFNALQYVHSKTGNFSQLNSCQLHAPRWNTDNPAPYHIQQQQQQQRQQRQKPKRPKPQQQKQQQRQQQQQCLRLPAVKRTRPSEALKRLKVRISAV